MCFILIQLDVQYSCFSLEEFLAEHVADVTCIHRQELETLQEKKNIVHPVGEE
jgi:hypothetical protein